jgi:hypothetical protein
MIKKFIYIIFISIFLAILSQAPVWAQFIPRVLKRVTPPNPPAQVDFEGQFIPGDHHELVFVTSYGCHACQTAKKVIAEVRAKAPANVKVVDIPVYNAFIPAYLRTWAIFYLTLTKMGIEEKLRDEIFELTLQIDNIGPGGKIPLGSIVDQFSFLNARGYNGSDFLKIAVSNDIRSILKDIIDFTTPKSILVVPIVIIDGKYYYTFPEKTDGFTDYLLDYVKTHPKGASPKTSPKTPEPKPSEPNTPGLTVTSLAY